MPRRLTTVINALLVLHHASHAVLIGGGLAWLATALGLETNRGGHAPAALIAIVLFSVAWQSARLFALASEPRLSRSPRPPGTGIRDLGSIFSGDLRQP